MADPNQWSLFDEDPEQLAFDFSDETPDLGSRDYNYTRVRQALNAEGEPFDEDMTSTDTAGKRYIRQQDIFNGPQYQIPTSTTNPKRPRTVAAKYNPQTREMTVLMRPDASGDCPIIVYPGIPQTTWNNFRAAISKGAYIAAIIDPMWRGGEVPHWERAPYLSDAFLAQAVTRARAEHSFAEQQQHHLTGIQRDQNPLSARRARAMKYLEDKRLGRTTRYDSLAEALGYGRGNLGGTGRKRA